MNDMAAVPNARPQVACEAGPRAADLDSVAMLGDRARRALYAYVVSQDRPVSRDDAAGATGIKRPTAAFHLDRMVEEGLLDVGFARLSGRTGPGAGRTAKLYSRSHRQIEVSLPPRRYEIAGEILAGAVEEALESSGGLAEAVARAAERAGRRLAAEDSQRRGSSSGQRNRRGAHPAVTEAGRPGAPAAADRPGELPPGTANRLSELLAAVGFEPRAGTAGEVRLANCPFHDLAVRHTRLVCEMNRHLLQGVLDELGLPAQARLDPSPRGCCVVIAVGEGPPRPGGPSA
jgi:predicted ArsR family transcriptional regulator